MRTQMPNKVVAFVILTAATLFFVLLFSYHKISGAIDNKYQEPVTIEWAQASFVNLDGRVQIKKVNSARWVEADYRTMIEKGDMVRTGSHGTAHSIQPSPIR